MSPRYAKISDIREALEARGINPRHALGQNFLIDPNLQRFVADAAELDSGDVVLEIGPGTGALTAHLCERAGAVVAVELDPGLAEMACELREEFDNLAVIEGDALERGRIAASVADAVAEARERVGGGRLKLVANLPYGAGTAAMRALLTHGPRPELMVVTVQREVVDRMVAGSGSKEYGVLTLLLQTNGTVERLRNLRPEVFWPRPKVTSSVARVRVRPGPDVAPGALIAVAGKLMEQRRKSAGKAAKLAGFCANSEEAEAVFGACGVDPRTRPDRITVEQYACLTRKLGGNAT